MEQVIDLNKVKLKPYITKELLLNEVSDENIFRYYIKDLQIGKIMNSPLRKDLNPSFGVFMAKPQNELFYKDFNLGSGDCIKFIQELLNLSYLDALSQIAVDFNLEDKFKLSRSLEKTPIIGTYNKSNKRAYKDVTKVINVTHRDWEEHDLKFWGSFGVTLPILQAYNVYPIKWLFINDDVFPVHKYAYAFREEKDGIVSFKIYQPFSKYKWISNHNKTVHQGYMQLPDNYDIFIITKSLKDVMSLASVTGIPSIAPQNETIIIKNTVIEEYQNRFNNVFTLFDNDQAGITLSFRYNSLYKLPILLIPAKYGCKDFSDLVKKVGADKALRILKELINEKI